MRDFFEPRFGVDFSAIRIHAGHEAQKAADALRARAFTIGPHLAFGAGEFAPGSEEGRRLLAHELAHAVQQAQAPTAPPIIYRRIRPEDVSSEMVHQQFTTTRQLTIGAVTLPAGARVTVTAWSNTSDSITVTSPLVSSPFLIDKLSLRPTRPHGTSMHPYSANVAGAENDVIRAEQRLARFNATHHGHAPILDRERIRLEHLVEADQRVLNRRLIQETMFNRFDRVIEREVTAANRAHGLHGAHALDPNLLKALLFQETQLGTSGQHLEVPPSHPVKTRFNLGQVIDSSGTALLIFIVRERPALVPRLGDLALLVPGTHRLSSSERARRNTLLRAAGRDMEGFLWSQPVFSNTVAALFAETTPGRNFDYEFWIHMAVLWLFEKHTHGRSWADTIRAYNGSGAAAMHYRRAIEHRAAAAARASAMGREFVPGRI